MKAWNTSPDPQTPRGVGTEHIERHAGLIAPAGEHFVWKSKLNLVNVFGKGVHPGKPSRGDQPQRGLGRLLWVALPWQHKVRLGFSHVISSCDLQFWFSSFDLHLGLCKTQVCQPRCSLCLETFWARSQDLIQAIWQSFGKWYLRKSAVQLDQQSFVDLLTSIIFTFRLFLLSVSMVTSPFISIKWCFFMGEYL